MDARLQQMSRNETLFRAANRKIEQAGEDMGASPRDLQTFFCECGDVDCSQTVELTLAEYEDTHAQRNRYVVAPGHDVERLERVVEHNRRYLVVEKYGEAERIAEDEERSAGVE